MRVLCTNPPGDKGSKNLRYCGRNFSIEEIEVIRFLIVSKPRRNRHQLSKVVCEQLNWRRPDGRVKDMSCRVAMLRMDHDELIRLPPPERGNGNGRTRPKITAVSDPQPPLCARVETLGEISLHGVRTQKDSSLWNELIERYHYLGYTPLPGAQLRYLIFSHSTLAGGAGLRGRCLVGSPQRPFHRMEYRAKRSEPSSGNQ